MELHCLMLKSQASGRNAWQEFSVLPVVLLNDGGKQVLVSVKTEKGKSKQFQIRQNKPSVHTN